MTDDGPAETAILIHGAWQGSWGWDLLAPRLAAAGIPVVAVDLPGNGRSGPVEGDITLDDYLDHLGRVLDEVEGNVSVVGHSGGGLVATAVGEAFRERVSRIAYVAGMMLPSRMAFSDLRQAMSAEVGAAPGITAELVWSSDGRWSSVPRAAAKAIFYTDCTSEQAEAAAARLTPQPEGGRAISVVTTAARFGTLPRLYVEATEDRSIPVAMQRRMQELVPGARVVSLPTGHAPQLSAPDLLAEALIPFLRGQSMALSRNSHRPEPSTGVLP